MSEDPIEQYLKANVPVRVLLEHGAERLDWLTHLAATPIVISYRDEAGEIVNEEVTKIGLIERAHYLGWKPTEHGERDCIDFTDTVAWEDAADQPDAVAGIWFAHEDAVLWEGHAFGTPMGIPTQRFAGIYARGKAEYGENQRRRAELDLREKLKAAAARCDSYINTRFMGRLNRDGVKLGHSQAWEEVQAISEIHGIDLFTDESFPPLPWSDEQKIQLRDWLWFFEDIQRGKPVAECRRATPLPGVTQEPQA